MRQELEKLDISMKNLCLELMKHDEDSITYKQLINELANQYHSCKTLCDMLEDENFYFKYASLEDINTLLANAGYLEQLEKKTTR